MKNKENSIRMMNANMPKDLRDKTEGEITKTKTKI